MPIKSVTDKQNEKFGNKTGQEITAKSLKPYNGPKPSGGDSPGLGDPKSKSDSSSPKDADKDSDTVGSGYDDSEKPSFRESVRGNVKKHRNKILIGGAAGGGLLGLGIAAFIALVPLKIEMMISNLQSHFDSTSTSAMQGEIKTLFTDYMVQYVLPGYKTCGLEITKFCQINLTASNNPVLSLYKDWHQARLESKLAGPPYNIEFKYYPDAKEWHLITPETSAEGVDIGADGEKLDQVFNDIPEAREALYQAVKDETNWYNVYTRYKVRRLLDEKYGLKDCLLFCGTRLTIKNFVKDQTKAARILLVQRVIKPRSQSLSIALTCLFQGSDCATKPIPDADPEAVAEDGASADTSVSVPISDALRALAKTYKIEDEASLLALQNLVNDINEKGLQKWLFTTILQKVGFSPSAAATTSNAIPVIGWANMAFQLISAGNSAGPKLKLFRYAVNTSAAIAAYSMYNTFSDELRTGGDSAAAIGSMTDSLSGGNTSTPTDPELGGTADMTQTPLYQYLNGDNTEAAPVTSTIISSIVSPLAYADSTSSTNKPAYLCNDGNPVPQGQLVCPEEQVGGGNGIADSVHSFLNLPGIDAVTQVAHLWEDSVGKLFNWGSDIIGSVFSGLASGADHSCSATGGALPPGYCQLKTLTAGAVTKIFDGVTKWLIPDPLSDNMSGGRTYDMVALGADASNAQASQNILGGQALNTTQVNGMINQQQTLALDTFSHQSLSYRLFSTSSQYSLISRIAEVMPLTRDAIFSSIASFISNPFKSVIHAFGSIFDSKVLADSNQPDPFGVTQYGYTQADLNAIGDPAVYWQNNCNDNSSDGYQNGNTYNMEAAATTDPNTGEPYNSSTDPCELIEASVGSAGGIFDTSLLTPDDLADTSQSSSNITSASTGSDSYENPLRDITNLVPQRIDQGVDYDGSGPIYAIGNGTVNGIYQNWCTVIDGCTSNEPLVAYTLSNGPASGKTVYVAECITPEVKAGQQVTTNTVIAQMTECGNGIETGWANTSNLPDSMALQCWDQVSSSFGVNFSQLLQSLGAKPGVVQEADPPCTLPPGWPTWS